MPYFTAKDVPCGQAGGGYHDVRQLRRQGLDWLQHHESWLKKSGVRLTDRSVHEHSAICRVLNLMTSYDQLDPD